MAMIKRILLKDFNKHLKPGKVLLLLGARRTGKTVFMKQLIGRNKKSVLILNGEDQYSRELLKVRSIENYKRIVAGKKLLIIDEAQNIPDIGWILKLMVDEVKGIKIAATGSSGFDLGNRTGEPLTGRKITFHLYPLSQLELSDNENQIQTISNLENRLVYGSYPEIITGKNHVEKARYLKELVNSYLLKDILALENVKNSSKMLDLLRLLAFQTGQLTSLEELGRQLGMSKNTVDRYTDLLSKVFIIYKLTGYSRNLRSEITKNSKWYFYDNGIRNALISNLNPIALRNDIGALWENYLITERIKYREYTGINANHFFWRTYEKQEIDYIEERNGNLFAYQIKWNEKRNSSMPTLWGKTYPQSEYNIINKDNYLDWIT